LSATQIQSIEKTETVNRNCLQDTV